jgi:hypothetical protein
MERDDFGIADLYGKFKTKYYSKLFENSLILLGTRNTYLNLLVLRFILTLFGPFSH